MEMRSFRLCLWLIGLESGYHITLARQAWYMIPSVACEFQVPVRLKPSNSKIRIFLYSKSGLLACMLGEKLTRAAGIHMRTVQQLASYTHKALVTSNLVCPEPRKREGAWTGVLVGCFARYGRTRTVKLGRIICWRRVDEWCDPIITLALPATD